MEMRPIEPPEFIAGPPIRPSDTLLDWLDAEAASDSSRQFKLPVVVRLDMLGMGVDEAFVGVSDADKDEDSVFLDLNDGAMGISLASRVKRLCPQGQRACAVWIEGYWGGSDGGDDLMALMSGPPMPGDDDRWGKPFSALVVRGLVEAGDARAHIEKSDG